MDKEQAPAEEALLQPTQFNRMQEKWPVPDMGLMYRTSPGALGKTVTLDEVIE